MTEAQNLSSRRGLKDCAFERLFGPWGYKVWTTYHPQFKKFKFLVGCPGRGVWEDVEVLNWSVHFFSIQISYHWNCTNNLPYLQSETIFVVSSLVWNWIWIDIDRNLQAMVGGCTLFAVKYLFDTRVNNAIRNKLENCPFYVTICVTNRYKLSILHCVNMEIHYH